MNDQARTDPLSSNIKAIADLEKTATMSRSVFARLCDRITQEAGTTWSIGLHVLIFSGWVLVNSPWFSSHPVDPFPFSFLTSVLSIEAIVLTLFVLATQNRLTRESDKRAQLDLQVNLLAEQEMTLVLKMLRDLCDHFDITDTTSSSTFRQLASETNVASLADQIERDMGPPGSGPSEHHDPAVAG